MRGSAPYIKEENAQYGGKADAGNGTGHRQLNEWRDEIAVFLSENLHLDLNSKTAIRPVSLGADFVGYHIWATHRKLKKQTARRMIRHVATMCEMLNAGEMSREAFDRVAASYGGVLKHCDSYGLRAKLNAIYTEKVEGGKDYGHTNHKSGARGVSPDGQRRV